jgi:hypothetical protein
MSRLASGNTNTNPIVSFVFFPFCVFTCLFYVQNLSTAAVMQRGCLSSFVIRRVSQNSSSIIKTLTRLARVISSACMLTARRPHSVKTCKHERPAKEEVPLPLRGIEPRSGRFRVLHMRAADASHYTITDLGGNGIAFMIIS